MLDSIGANARNRTADLLITNQLLCRLSYVGSPDREIYHTGGGAAKMGGRVGREWRWARSLG